MHPAKSVIFFTTMSGAGYGLVTMFALFDLAGLVPGDRATTVSALGCAVVLVVAGLVSSTFHLGHPERAWRALSQWRSSWLSREGVLAVATFVPIAAYGGLRLFFGADSAASLGAGLVAAAFAAATVYCTAMIYASLRPVQAWATAWTPASYGVLALMSGAVLANAVTAILGAGSTAIAATAAALTLAGLAVKAGYWRRTSGDPAISTPETATGLGASGRVRLLEAPHTEANYLMKEMGFRVARKHAAKLRLIAVVLGFAVPVIFLGISVALGGAAALSLAAIMSMIAGLLVERWLFFAEAKHTVGLYYGIAG